eukprot:3859243-Rhodomonas_salina.2
MRPETLETRLTWGGAAEAAERVREEAAAEERREREREREQLEEAEGERAREEAAEDRERGRARQKERISLSGGPDHVTSTWASDRAGAAAERNGSVTGESGTRAERTLRRQVSVKSSSLSLRTRCALCGTDAAYGGQRSKGWRTFWLALRFASPILLHTQTQPALTVDRSALARTYVRDREHPDTKFSTLNPKT